jgi:hypothetical protein
MSADINLRKVPPRNVVVGAQPIIRSDYSPATVRSYAYAEGTRRELSPTGEVRLVGRVGLEPTT